MKWLKSLEIGIVFIIIISAISGCGNNVSAEDVTAALETKNTDQIIQSINLYQEQGNKETLDAVVVDYIKSLGVSDDYEDYVFMEELAKKVPDEKLRNDLNTVIGDCHLNKIIAFTSGEWERRDYTNEDGMVIDIKWADNKGTAIINNAKVKNNKNGFQGNDVKWRNATVISENELSYEDLWKTEGDPSYKQAYGIIDFENNQIICNITADSNEEYENGTKQVWIKKDVIDTTKEELKDKDFLIMDQDSWEEPNGLYFEFNIESDYINNKELRKKVKKWLKRIQTII